MSAIPCSTGATRRCTLNPDGERLLAAIGPALDALGLAMERGDRRARADAAAARRAAALRLAAADAASAAAARAASRSSHRHRHRRPTRLARLDEGLDAAIVLATAGRSRPLCAPARQQPRRRDRRARAGRGPDALTRRRATSPTPPCCSTATCPTRSTIWQEAIGVPDLEPAAIDHFDSGQLILEAAAQGLGVAFMFESHLEDAHDDRLVQLFDSRAEPLQLLVRLPPPGARPPPGQAVPRLAGRGTGRGHRRGRLRPIRSSMRGDDPAHRARGQEAAAPGRQILLRRPGNDHRLVAVEALRGRRGPRRGVGDGRASAACRSTSATSKNSVAVGPGQSAVTLMPLPFSSWWSASVKDRT